MWASYTRAMQADPDPGSPFSSPRLPHDDSHLIWTAADLAGLGLGGECSSCSSGPCSAASRSGEERRAGAGGSSVGSEARRAAGRAAGGGRSVAEASSALGGLAHPTPSGYWGSVGGGGGGGAGALGGNSVVASPGGEGAARRLPWTVRRVSRKLFQESGGLS